MISARSSPRFTRSRVPRPETFTPSSAYAKPKMGIAGSTVPEFRIIPAVMPTTVPLMRSPREWLDSIPGTRGRKKVTGARRVAPRPGQPGASGAREVLSGGRAEHGGDALHVQRDPDGFHRPRARERVGGGTV